jgi:hypothetical protein
MCGMSDCVRERGEGESKKEREGWMDKEKREINMGGERVRERHVIERTG